MAKRAAIGDNSGHRLRAFVERIERLNEEKAAIQADITSTYGEAKSVGYDPKVIRAVVKLRSMEASDRQEFEALLDLYKAELGMLGDTPLGAAAIKRLEEEEKKKREAKKPKPDDKEAGAGEGEPAPQEPSNGAAPMSSGDDDPFGLKPPPAEDIEAAREQGRQAAREGQRVSHNPYVAGDPRRAAWDEAWCQETASDGMDLPAAWRRKPKEEKDETPAEAEAEAADGESGDAPLPFDAPPGPAPSADPPPPPAE